MIFGIISATKQYSDLRLPEHAGRPGRREHAHLLAGPGVHADLFREPGLAAHLRPPERGRGPRGHHQFLHPGRHPRRRTGRPCGTLSGTSSCRPSRSPPSRPPSWPA
ncbi:MAG: hypothetical protein MZV70_52495 [Desulfobacterales bacterium]|nr:hypothetical protein [Desulfobacterales bacterium]